MKRIAAFAAFVVLAASANAAPYGLAVGSTWRVNDRMTVVIRTTNVPGSRPYIVKSVGTQYHKVVGQEDEAFPDDAPAFVVQTTTVLRSGARKTTIRSKEYSAFRTGGLYSLGEQDIQPPGDLVEFESPLLERPWPLKLGQKWPRAFRASGIDGVVQCRVVGREPVRVAGKRYENAYRIEGRSSSLMVDLELTPGTSFPVESATLKATEWVVPDIGAVKTDFVLFAKVEAPAWQLDDLLGMAAQRGILPSTIKGTLRIELNHELAAFAPGKVQPAKKAAQ